MFRQTSRTGQLQRLLVTLVASALLFGEGPWSSWCFSPSAYLTSWEASERARCKAGGTPIGLAPAAKIDDRQDLKDAILGLIKDMTGLRLGIMAPNEEAASESLKRWLLALALPTTEIRLVDEENQPAESALSGAVYLKYSYVDNSGDPQVSAYMKPYPFAGRGVLFNPDLPDGEMHMYGDFPLALFEE